MRKKIFSVFFAVVLLLSFSLVTAVPVAADPGILNVYPLQPTTKNTDSTAEWSATQFYAGSLAAHLDSGTTTQGDEARVVVNMPAGTTLDDITTISWWEYNVAGYPPHVDVKVDKDGNGTADDALVFEYAYNTELHCDEAPMPYGALTGAWYQTFGDDSNGPTAIDDTANAWLSSGPPGPLGDPSFIYGTLANWKDGTVDVSVDGDTAVTALEIEVDNWVVNSEAYVDDITINGVVYYGQIQDAIDTAFAGETINVAAGTYAESVIVDKSLTLLGAKSNVDPRAGAWTSDITTINAGEGNNGILITASGVTVNGFKIVESGVHAYAPWGPSAIQAYNETAELEDLNIIYNWMDSNYGSGIIVRSAIEPVVEYNYVSNSGTDSAAGVAGLELTLGSFSYNEVFNCLSYGMYFGGGTEPDEPSGITGTLISYNNLHHNEKYGLQLYGYYGLVLTGLRQGVRLENNNFHDNGRNGIKLTDFTDTIVKDNQFSNNGGDGTSDKYKYGALVSAFYTVAGTEFTGNTFSGNELGGIYFLESVGGADFSNITVNFNDFLEGGTKSGIMNTTPAEIDAEDNWWGNASGPTHADNTFNVGNQGDAVSDLVDFVPWLNAPYDTALSFAPVALDGDADYSSIQAAINAATSSNITCAAGTYTENPLVDKGVALQGDPGANIKGTIQIAADGATVDGFSITDFDDAWSVDKFWGIFIFSGTGVTVSNNVIDGAACLDTLFPNKNVMGIETCSGSGASASIEGNTIKNVRLGIAVNVGNTLTITGNTVEDTVKGIITGASPLTATITENIIRNNGIGIEVSSAENVAIHYNSFCGNTLFGVQHIGPPPEVDATNNYWCSASGPSHSPGEGDPVSGNVLYEPWLLEELVPGEELPTTFEKTLALKIGWTLVSVDNWIDPASAVGADVTLAYSYIPGGGYTEVTPAALVPVDALYLKTDIGGGVGFDYSGGVPVASTKDLVVGWNLISSATYWNAQDILSPLRYIDVGDEQGVGLATLVSQGYFNQHTPSFYLSAVMPLDWGRLGYTTLNPFDGYWVYMNGPKSFGVIPGAQPPPN